MRRVRDQNVYLCRREKKTSGEYLLSFDSVGETFQVFYRFPFSIFCARISRIRLTAIVGVCTVYCTAPSSIRAPHHIDAFLQFSPKLIFIYILRLDLG